MKTIGTLAAALALFGAGLICGYVVRRFGSSASAVPDWLRAPAQSETAASVPRNGATLREVKEERGNFAVRLDALASTSNPSKRGRAIAGIADELDAREIREALANLEKRSVRDAREIRLRLLSRWAEFDPGAALEYAKALPSGSEAPHAIKAVIGRWAEIDAKGAAEGVEGMRESFAKRIARGALLPALSESDPRAAFALLQQSTPFGEDVRTLFDSWAEKNPAEAAAHAAQLPGWQRSIALRNVAQKWAKADRDAALAWAQSWQTENPPGVTIERRDPGPLAAVLETWMSEDASATIQWLEQLPTDARQTDILAALSASLSDNEPQHAVEVAAMMPTGKAQDSALRNLISKWSRKDFAGALTWAQQQPDEEVRQILLPTLVNDLAWRDPSAALHLALSVGGDAGTRAVSTVVRAWTQKEPAAAAEWASMQPESASYVASVASAWAQKDRAAALEWVSILPDGAVKDGALENGVRMIAQSDQPQMAEEWIAGIGNEVKRKAAYQELAFWWLRADPKKAREWITTAPLSAKAKADLLQGSSK